MKINILIFLLFISFETCNAQYFLMTDTVDLGVPRFDIDELRKRLDEIDSTGFVSFSGERNVLRYQLAESLFYSFDEDEQIESIKLCEDIMKCSDAKSIAAAANCIAIAYYKGSHGYPQDYCKAFAYWQKACYKFGYSDRRIVTTQMYNLGCCYYYGKGCEKNISKAIECWHGSDFHPHSFNNLAVCYWENGDYQKAYNMFYKAANESNNSNAIRSLCYLHANGYIGEDSLSRNQNVLYYIDKGIKNRDSFCHYIMGTIYEKGGYGIDIDKEKAISEYESAWFVPEAKRNLGEIYLWDNNIEKSKYYFSEAADKNDTYSQYMLGMLNCYIPNITNYSNLKALSYQPTEDKFSFINGIEWLEKSANNGNWEALDKIANFYFYGNVIENDSVLKRDYNKSLMYFEKLVDIEQNDSLVSNLSKAEHNAILGIHYNLGLGIKKDYVKATTYYSNSIKYGGTCAAYNNLGGCYEDGLGVDKDLKKAYELYSMAVYKDSTDTYSLGNLGSCYYYGKGCEKNFETAAHYLAKASEAEFPLSETLYLLSKCYRFGYGVKQDEEKANSLLLKSQKLGNDSAIMLMEKTKRLR